MTPVHGRDRTALRPSEMSVMLQGAHGCVRLSSCGHGSAGQGLSLGRVQTASPPPFWFHDVCKGRGNPEPSSTNSRTPGWTNGELEAQRTGTPMNEGRGPGDRRDQALPARPQPPASGGQVLGKSFGASRAPRALLRDLPPGRRVVTPAVSAPQGVGARGGHGLPGHPGRPPPARPVRGLRGGGGQVSSGSGTGQGRAGRAGWAAGRGGQQGWGLRQVSPRPQAQTHLEVPPERRRGSPVGRGCHGVEGSEVHFHGEKPSHCPPTPSRCLCDRLCLLAVAPTFAGGRGPLSQQCSAGGRLPLTPPRNRGRCLQTFSVVTARGGGGVTGLRWSEARHAAKQPAGPRTVPATVLVPPECCYTRGPAWAVTPTAPQDAADTSKLARKLRISKHTRALAALPCPPAPHKRGKCPARRAHLPQAPPETLASKQLDWTRGWTGGSPRGLEQRGEPSSSRSLPTRASSCP